MCSDSLGHVPRRKSEKMWILRELSSEDGSP
jgi:hypothetical protein